MKRVIRAKGNVGKLTWFQIVALINYDWFKTPGKPTFSSEEERRAAWFAHRDILMARRGDHEFGRYPHGTRPTAWWQYEAPEPRRQIAGPSIKPIGNELARGIPSLWESKPDGVVFESEYRYLKRLNLLFPGEDELVRDAEKKDDGE